MSKTKNTIPSEIPLIATVEESKIVEETKTVEEVKTETEEKTTENLTTVPVEETKETEEVKPDMKKNKPKILLIAETTLLAKDLVVLLSSKSWVVVVDAEQAKKTDLKKIETLVFVGESHIHPINFEETLANVLAENEKVGIVGMAPFSPNSSLVFDKNNLAYYPAIAAGTLAIRKDDFLKISSLEQKFEPTKLCVKILELKKNCYYHRSGGEEEGYKYAQSKSSNSNQKVVSKCCY